MTATPAPSIDPEAEVYRAEEVARLFRVNIKTLGTWDRAGFFPPGTVFRTMGGHRRFRGDAIRELLAGAR